MLARMHGKRLTTYRRLGFTVPPAVPPPAMPDRLIPPPGLPVPAIPYSERPGGTLAAAPTASQVRAWARGQGLEVPDRGRLSSEIWSAYQREHAHAG
jgi:Lsr2 protein